MEQTQYWERKLTPLELDERKNILIELLSDHETLTGEIDDAKRTISARNTKKKSLEFQIGTTRREIQRGYVYEKRQVEITFVSPEKPVEPGDLADELGNIVEDPRPEARPADMTPEQRERHGQMLAQVSANDAALPDAEPVDAGEQTVTKPAKKKRKRARKVAGR